VLWVGAVDGVDEQVWDVHVQRLFASRVARAKHVLRHPGDHSGQPSAGVLQLAGVGTAESQPRILDSIVGLAERAEHALGHRPHTGPVLLNLPGEPLRSLHVTFLRRVVSRD
jgi:hypothetical protein